VPSCNVLFMTEAADHAVPPLPVEEWFSRRGYSIAISGEKGVFWAGLVNATGRLVTPRYGRGADPSAAAESARQRFIVEEEPGALE
jgi:hypothetical protein